MPNRQTNEQFQIIDDDKLLSNYLVKSNDLLILSIHFISVFHSNLKNLLQLSAKHQSTFKAEQIGGTRFDACYRSMITCHQARKRWTANRVGSYKCWADFQSFITSKHDVEVVSHSFRDCRSWFGYGKRYLFGTNEAFLKQFFLSRPMLNTTTTTTIAARSATETIALPTIDDQELRTEIQTPEALATPRMVVWETEGRTDEIKAERQPKIVWFNLTSKGLWILDLNGSGGGLIKFGVGELNLSFFESENFIKYFHVTSTPRIRIHVVDCSLIQHDTKLLLPSTLLTSSCHGAADNRSAFILSHKSQLHRGLWHHDEWK